MRSVRSYPTLARRVHSASPRVGTPTPCRWRRDESPTACVSRSTGAGACTRMSFASCSRTSSEKSDLGTLRANSQPTFRFSRQTRASPAADRAVSGGQQRFRGVEHPQRPSRRIPLNHAENGSGKPRISARAKTRFFGAWDFETAAFNRSATPPGSTPPRLAIPAYRREAKNALSISPHSPASSPPATSGR
jgi:hypothetical protein